MMTEAGAGMLMRQPLIWQQILLRKFNQLCEKILLWNQSETAENSQANNIKALETTF